MARFLESDERYTIDADIGISRGGLDREEVNQVVDQLTKSDIGQVSPTTVTADQNNYSLPEAELVRLSTDASRTFTGFAGARPGRFVICNVGANDLVIANNSGSSTDINRVLCHTGANITLNPNESVTIIYDFDDSRWRTIGFA